MHQEYYDNKYNPGDDFFKHVTGHWIDYHPQPDDKPSWGTFDVLDEEVTKKLDDIIHNFDESDPMQKKMKMFLDVMTDYDRRNRERFEPLHKYINKLHSLKTKDEILKFCIGELGVDMFVSIGVSPDFKNSNHYEVHIEQDLTLGNKEYYLSDNPDTIAVREKYQEVMQKMYMLAGYSEQDAEMLTENIFNLEYQYVDECYSLEKLDKPEENYHPMTVDEFTKEMNYDLRKLLSYYDYNETEKVIVCQPEPVKKALEVMNNCSLIEFGIAAEANILAEYLGTLSEDFNETYWEFIQFMSGAKERPPKWKRIVHTMDDVFNHSIGKIFSERYFSEEAKQEVIKMVENIKISFAEIILRQDWMSDKTKMFALKKLAAMRYDKIGFPNKWEDFSDVPIDPQKSYLENHIALWRYGHEYTLRKYYNKDVDPEEWPMMPQTVNACYIPTQNEICFPAAMLQEPFFDAKRSSAENYGAIGVVIGHEMTHGFDSAGRQFDENGNMSDWWSPEDAQRFEEEMQPVKDRFNSLEVLPDLKCNGNLTADENVADFGGLKIAYNACQKLINKESEAIRILSEGWSILFFNAFATMWAGVDTEEVIKNDTLNNTHSINYIRVNGTLPMMDEWYDTVKMMQEQDLVDMDNTIGQLYVPKGKRAKIWN